MELGEAVVITSFGDYCTECRDHLRIEPDSRVCLDLL